MSIAANIRDKFNSPSGGLGEIVALAQEIYTNIDSVEFYFADDSMCVLSGTAREDWHLDFYEKIVSQ